MSLAPVLSEPQGAVGKRVGVAIISNSQTPYRLHLHQRIAREIPQIKLWSLYTHETSNSKWQFAAPEEIGAVQFGEGESALDQPRAKFALKEWKRAGRIIAWMKEHEIRFVVMMGYNDAGRIRIMRWCRWAGVPCFLFGDSNIHGDKSGGVKGIAKRVIVGRIVGWCSGVMVCGDLGKDYFVKYGGKRERMFYFPYEPDYGLLENVSGEAIEQVKRRFGLAEGRRRIVYSGRLVDVKRVDLLIEAFVAIAGQRPGWDLVIVGDGPLKNELHARLPAELAGRVVWAGFIDDQATVSAIYRASDVLVLPSDFEPWALVINEAAAAGMAIVSSNVVGAAGELVRDGVNGRLFPAGDAKALADCLLDVTDETKVDAMKAASGAVLADWRERGDPVEGLRGAMRAVQVIR